MSLISALKYYTTETPVLWRTLCHTWFLFGFKASLFVETCENKTKNTSTCEVELLGGLVYKIHKNIEVVNILLLGMPTLSSSCALHSVPQLWLSWSALSWGRHSLHLPRKLTQLTKVCSPHQQFWNQDHSPSQMFAWVWGTKALPEIFLYFLFFSFGINIHMLHCTKC